MTNWGFEDNGNTEEQGENNFNGPNGLRKFAEKTQQENKDLKNQLQQIQDQLRKQELRTVFDDLGVPNALDVYQGEADPEKAKAWVENMRKTFGGNIQGTPGETPTVDTVPTESLPPMLQQQMEQFNNAGQQGQPLGSFEQASANVNDATDLQGLINAMQFGR